MLNKHLHCPSIDNTYKLRINTELVCNQVIITSRLESNLFHNTSRLEHLSYINIDPSYWWQIELNKFMSRGVTPECLFVNSSESSVPPCRTPLPTASYIIIYGVALSLIVFYWCVMIVLNDLILYMNINYIQSHQK